MTPEDFMPALTVAAMILLLVMAARVAGSIQRKRSARAASAVRRLGAYAAHGREYSMFIGFKGADIDLSASGYVIPRSADRGDRWLPLTTADDEAVTLENGTRVPMDAVESFVVAYPGGRIIDAHAPFEPLPPGLYFPQSTPALEEDTLRLEELTAGREWLAVDFRPAEFPEPVENRWQIRVTNTGPEAIRVVSFGIYHCDGEDCVLATESGAAYDADEFIEWFGREESPWLEPGESALDPNGFGTPGQAWAFYFETRGGQDIVAGTRVPE
jgi:hypothetical protein